MFEPPLYSTPVIAEWHSYDCTKSKAYFSCRTCILSLCLLLCHTLVGMLAAVSYTLLQCLLLSHMLCWKENGVISYWLLCVVLKRRFFLSEKIINCKCWKTNEGGVSRQFWIVYNETLYILYSTSRIIWQWNELDQCVARWEETGNYTKLWWGNSETFNEILFAFTCHLLLFHAVSSEYIVLHVVS